MGASELLALSLGLSVAVAAAAWAGGRIVEALSADPRLRDRIWATALVLPALPPLMVGLMLLSPAPVREIGASAPAFASPVVMEGIAEPSVAGLEPTFVVDPGPIAMAVLVLAGLLIFARLVALAPRVRRLARMVREAAEPDLATAGMVEAAACVLSIPAPRIGVSATAPEPLLAGFARPRLILPAGLTAAADVAVVRAVIAHELVHLKRGDHRALWLEEVLLVLLAINPLMPMLRARRAAAREEACDALALADAAPETRRAYAESLIEALRSRASPQPLPALTFTGAGRRTVMRRLKAVLVPAAPAGRGALVFAAAVGCTLLAGAAAASVAVAGQREPTLRPAAPPDRAAPPAKAAPLQTADSRPSMLTPEQQARFRNPTGAEYQAICTSADTADDAFCAGVIVSQFPRSGAESGGDICLPAELEQGDEAAGRAALGTLVERTKAEIARASIRPGDHGADVARSALARAYPCDARAAAFRAAVARLQAAVPLTVAIDIEGRPLSVQGDETLRVVLTDENGVVMNTHGTMNSGSGRASGPLGPLGMAIAAEDFPDFSDAARVYTLTGEIRGPGRVLRYVAEPVTLRLAPGARRADLRPTLSFRPA